MPSPRITASLTYWRTRTPDAVAIECDGTALTWRELADRVESLADRLAADGLRAGDRIGYLCQNGIGVISTILAAVALDAVVVPLNIRLTVSELGWIVDDAGLDALLADEAYRRQALALREGRALRVYWQGPGCPSWADPLEGSAGAARGRLKRTVGDPDVPAFISYTSGTTGRPKGAVLTHGNFLAAAISFSTTESMTRHDSCLLVLPLAFTGSLMATWAPTYYTGARFVMHPRFDAAQTLAELEDGGITVFPAVPVVFDQLAALPNFDTADLRTVRVAKAGGAPPSAATLARYLRRGMPIGQGYGMTESTGVGASLPQEDFERKAGSTGVPNFGIELAIMDADAKPLPDNEVGEICLRGAAVMLGYWRNPEATAETLRDGWLHTGDLGRLDDEGYLTIMGREKDMVLSGGLNVYPGEIERIIMLDPRVSEAAVVAVPDERWGEVPAAVVVSDSADLTAEMVRDGCRLELADYKVPRYVYVRPEPLPRTMSGKVAKAEVRTEISERLGGRA